MGSATTPDRSQMGRRVTYNPQRKPRVWVFRNTAMTMAPEGRSDEHDSDPFGLGSLQERMIRHLMPSFRAAPRSLANRRVGEARRVAVVHGVVDSTARVVLRRAQVQ